MLIFQKKIIVLFSIYKILNHSPKFVKIVNGIQNTMKIGLYTNKFAEISEKFVLRHVKIIENM